MQSSPRPRTNGGGGHSNRRGHTPQLSISSDAHHVTETIGDMYGDDNDSKRESTYSSSPASHQPYPFPSEEAQYSPRSRTARERPLRKASNDAASPKSNGAIRPPLEKKNSWDGDDGAIQGMRGRSPSDTANSQFPLNDIDYESSPAAVAQELSNLQALRRMSMDVAAAGDPDLPSMNSGSVIPSIAPSPSASEDDTSRLFWVPARLHPELAPKEFKSFLDNKADQIKRRSGEFSYDPEGTTSRSGSLGASGGLRRKKSMLSRQIDNTNGRGAEGYQDGAERLERKKSISQRSQPHDPNLQELEALVTDPSRMQRLSLESSKQAPEGEGSTAEDMPILPALAPGSSLRRSTRTTYRRSQTKKNEGGRMTFSKRMQEAEEKRKAAAAAAAPAVPSEPSKPDEATIGEPPMEEPRPLTRVSTEPSASSASRTTNFSRPARSPTDATAKPAWDTASTPTEQPSKSAAKPQTPSRQWSSQISSHGRSTLQIAPENQTVPQIVVETPPQPEQPIPQSVPITPVANSTSIQNRLPERTSSHQLPQQPLSSQQVPQRTESPPLSARSTSRPGMPPRSKSPQTFDKISGHPSPLPGTDTKTNDLSFIPTLTEDKKADGRRIKDKKEEPRKSSWNWLLGKEESEKEKKRDEEAPKKPKAKITKPPERHDNTRLDVLQSSIDGGNKARESLVLDRESVKLEEERKKESARKSSGSDTKKEKDGLFSSIFGGGKKKSGEHRKHASRALSPEPPPRQLRPDVDYNWTRFSLLEERAIYRMAHIKLANPRRPLYSQVLLSNFMYSYLAKVQQMHPQMNLPTSAKQQSQQQQAVKQKQDQPDEFTQYQRYQEQQAQLTTQQEYARLKMSGQGQNQSYGSQRNRQQDDYGDYDESSMYDYDNDGRRSRGGQHSHENGGTYGGAGGYGYYQQQQQHSDFGDEIQGEDDDMW